MNNVLTPTGVPVTAANGMPLGTAPEPLLTLEEFDAMDNKGFELIDGRLLEKPMGWKSSKTNVVIISALHTYCRPRRLGEVLDSEGGYRMFPARPRHVRKPDVSFVTAARLAACALDGWIDLAPDLAVEVVSTHDKAVLLEEKLDEYRAIGVPLIWVVWTSARKVEVYRKGGDPVTLRGDDVLSGEDVIPGFTLPLADIFAE